MIRNFSDHLLGESKIEEIPMHKEVREILMKILEQNSIILEQNSEILKYLSRPMLTVFNNISTEELRKVVAEK